MIIWRDNGVPGQIGYTEYSAYEVKAAGGIENIIEEYRQSGISVIKVIMNLG